VSVPRELVWHDVENAGYGEDLETWRTLADAHRDPVLDLGCGSGRVALDLARRGHRVCAVDSNGELLEALRRRAAEEQLEIEAIETDVRGLDLGGRRFDLALAPMQLLQLLPDAEARIGVMRRVAGALAPGGLFATAIVEGASQETWEEGQEPPLPDVREEGGWVYSSLPLSVRSGNGRIVIERLRQTVAPDGGLEEERDRVELAVLDVAGLEAEAREAGLVAAGRRSIAENDRYAAAVIALLRAPEEA
jgi:SAM-dependent methyltransferase